MLSDKDLREKEKELTIFKNVNGVEKKLKCGHSNFISTNSVSGAIKNQGVSRAKLREFIKKEGVDYDYWCK